MVRRPLVATVVTTVVGSLIGAALGALVGRVIALFGDATVQVSVPMVFCGTLGYFIGGAATAKGSLDRFGARRSALGGVVAGIILVVVVGAASLSHTAGVVIFVLGIVAAVLAGAAATLVAAPQSEPVVRGGVPRAVAPPLAAEAAPQEQVEAEFLVTPSPTPSVTVKKPTARKVVVAEPESEPEPEPVVDAADEPANWTLPEQPKARPKRDRPLSREDVKAAAPEIKPPPAPRQRRERPLRKGDS